MTGGGLGMDIRRVPAVAFTIIVCGLLAGCLTPPLASLVADPVYNFETTEEIVLREGPEDEDPVVALAQDRLGGLRQLIPGGAGVAAGVQHLAALEPGDRRPHRRLVHAQVGQQADQ